MTAEPPRTVSATVGQETIVLTVHGGADGSLVIADGHNLTLITLSMRRWPALLAACLALAAQLQEDAPDA